MINYAFHYITDSPEKIIKGYKRREERHLEQLNKGAKISEAFVRAFEGDKDGRIKAFVENDIAQEINKMETLVIYYRDRILSVYALADGNDKSTWGLGRGGHIARKQISLTVWVNWGRSGELTFWADEKLILSGESVDIIFDKFREKRELIKDIYNFDDFSFKTNVDRIGYLSEIIDFPLLLPDDWETRWTQERISSHIILVTDRKEETAE